MAKPEIPLSSIPLSSRYENGLFLSMINRLDYLWMERLSKIPLHFDRYDVKVHETLFALEQLEKQGLIPEATCFTQTDYLPLFKTENNPGILHGLSVGVVGGPEGEIFAALGAETVSIDPYLNWLPPHRWPNLTEVPHPLDSEIAATYACRFDLTFTLWVFTSGSKLTNGVSNYAAYLKLVLQMTKPGGISIHNGDMMPQIIETLDDSRIRVLEASPSFPQQQLGTPGVCIALKRLG